MEQFAPLRGKPGTFELISQKHQASVNSYMVVPE